MAYLTDHFNYSSGGAYSGFYWNETGLTEEEFREVMNEYRQNLLRDQDPATIVLLSLYAVVFLLALLGNVISLLVLKVLPRKHGITHNFLVNMTISDLLVALICIPATVVRSVYHEWVLGEVMCKLAPYLQGVAVVSSVLSITALSLDRFVAIRYPILAKRLNTIGHARAFIPSIWAVSLLVNIPVLKVRQLQRMEIFPNADALQYCQEKWPDNSNSRRAYGILLLSFVYVIPGTLIVTAYSKMAYHLKTGQMGRPPNHRCLRSAYCNRPCKSFIERRKVARAAGCVGCVFAACWLPFHLSNLILDWSGEENSLNTEALLTVLPFTLLLGHTNSAVNPLLYCFMGSLFRSKLRHLIRRRLVRRHSMQVSFAV